MPVHVFFFLSEIGVYDNRLHIPYEKKSKI